MSFLCGLTKSIEKGHLPALQTVFLLRDRINKGRCSGEAELFFKLKEKGVDICIVDAYLEETIANAGLTV